MSVRYFCCGEYGEKNGKAHFHALMHLSLNEQLKIPIHQYLTEHWQKGFVHIGEMNSATAHYTCRFTLKKSYNYKGHEILTSQKPAVGKQFIVEYAGRCAKKIKELDRIPHSFRFNGKKYPLDETMKKHFKNGFVENGGVITDKKLSPKTLHLIAKSQIILGGDPILEAREYAETLRQRKYSNGKI